MFKAFVYVPVNALPGNLAHYLFKSCQISYYSIMATVAVVIPVYATPENSRLEFLGQTLRSVQLQTHRDLVALVVDDGSPVNVECFIRESGYSAVRYIRRARSQADLKTASNALNFGIGLCLERSPDVFSRAEAGNLVAITYLHSDDLLPPESVAHRLSALKPGAAFVYADVIYVNAVNKPLGVKRSKWQGKCAYSPDLFHGFPHHTVMWAAEFANLLKSYVAERYGQDGIFDSRLSYGEDRDVSISSVEAAMKHGQAMIHLPEVAYAYRQHVQSISGEKASMEYIKIQRRLINAKHFSSHEMTRLRLLALLRHWASDLPWSLGYSLPVSIKRPMRPVRNFVKRKGRGVAKALSPDELRSLEGLLATLPSLPRHSLSP